MPDAPQAPSARTSEGRGFVEVADRVFVAAYPQWHVNVGLVIGRAGAVVIDTRASSVQGRQVLDDVRRLARDLTVTHVVNTHVHFDHTFGNVAFEDASVHAHDNVARTLEAHAEDVRSAVRADPQGDAELGYSTRDLLDLLETEVRMPDRTFGTEAAIDLGDRVVRLAYHGRGHTDGDIAVHVPDTGALFLGDLVEEHDHPSFGPDSWPLEWADTLDAHLAGTGSGGSGGAAAGPGDLGGLVVVPGHGRPVDAAFVRRQRDDVASVAAVIRERRDGGADLEAALAEPDARLPYPLPHLADAFRRGWAQRVRR